jgi:hypothetical protein
MRCIAVACAILLVVGCSTLNAQTPPASQPAKSEPAHVEPVDNSHADPKPAVLSKPTGDATPQPTTSRPATTQPGKTPPVTSAAKHELSSGDPRVDDILDRLGGHEAIKGLACSLTYRYVTVEPVEDAIVKEGELLYAVAKPNPKFYIHIDKMIAEGVIIPRHEYFLFDGRWLTERNDKAKTIIKREIVREGRKVDQSSARGRFRCRSGRTATRSFAASR